MTDDDTPIGQEPQLDDRLDWRELGRFTPRVPQARPRARRDLGPGGSIGQDAERARQLRRPQRRRGVPVAR